MFRTKRVYKPADKDDGYRVLVDRLWPRGLTKAKAHVDLWLKEVAPSNELRKWFGHEPEKWAEFQKKYRAELKKETLAALYKLGKEHKKVTLLYGAKSEERNQAVALLKVLQGKK
ncbi:MAG TPA: DUF488 family protein [Candidatus Sulfotelmatobacter sp.]|jgi:uncharacterized protein YeaO (DUF488 family)|nr:DUF488 family protein [Candidatus Sulfotelmatobacter sp.]